METLWRDLQYGMRTWSKAPGFTAIVVLTLAFGIGANTTVFTVINTLFLNPLPVARASELVVIRTVNRGDTGPGDALPISYPNLVDLRERNQVFQSLAGHSLPMPLTMLRSNAPERIFAELVTGSYFDTLGLRPARGRFFLPGEDAVPGAAPVLVMAYAAWQQKFGGDAAIVGRTLNVNGTVFTVLGVAPENFKGVNAVFGPDVWIPSMMTAQVRPEMGSWLTDRSALGFRGVGRLKPRVTPAQAGANLTTIAAALEREYPEPNRGRSIAVDSLTRAALIAPGRLSALSMSVLLMLVPALVLLIACSNVANLLLARAAARRREIAMRLALGSGRRRLIGQLLTESALLAVVSGLAGFGIAYAGCQILWSFRPPEVAPNLLDLDIDLTVLMFTALVSIATGVVFGIAPAWLSSRTDIIGALNEESQSVGRPRQGITLGRLLLVGQVALSLVSLVTAGLLLRSVQQAYRVGPGFEDKRLGIVLIGTGQAGYDRVRAEQFRREVRERLGAVPGIERVSWASNLPLFARASRSLTIEGQESRDGAAPLMTIVNAVDLDYFATTGVALTRGRDFSEADRDNSPAVAIVNETLAARHWPSVDPVGRRFRISGEESLREIVGIARTVSYGSVGEPPQPCIYLPVRQQPSEAPVLYIRAEGDLATALLTAQRHLKAIDARVEAADARTITTVVSQSLFGVTIGVGLLGVFGLIALGLASLGLYGAMAHSVRQRQREIGVRMALGAARGAVLGLVLRQGLAVVAIGIGVGLTASLLIGQALAGMLFGVTPADPLALGAAALALLLTATAACYLPARRASRLDPLQALRQP